MFCFAMESPEKGLDAGKHERTAIARPAEAQPVFGLRASFEAAWRPAHGEAQGFRLRTPNTARTRASPTNLMSALAHALKEKGSREGASQRPEAARTGNLQRRECFRGS